MFVCILYLAAISIFNQLNLTGCWSSFRRKTRMERHSRCLFFLLMSNNFSCRWCSRRAWWVDCGPQLCEEKTGAWTDADLAGLQSNITFCLAFFPQFISFLSGSDSTYSTHLSNYQIYPCLRVSPQDVQLKVKVYILGTDMSNFKYDDFIVVLDVISRYVSGLVQTARFHSANWASFSCFRRSVLLGSH